MAVGLSGATVFGKPLKVNLLEADSLSAAAEEKLFTNQIDPQEVKAQRQIVLIQIKGDKKIRSRRVELKLQSLNAGDVFVLDCGSKIYQWNGKYSTRFKKARGLDVASNIRLKERGGNAKIYFLEQESDQDVEDSDEMREFWEYFGITRGPNLQLYRDITIATAEQGGDDAQFEQWTDGHTKLYRISSLEEEEDAGESTDNGALENRIQTRLVHKGSQPSKAMFRSEFVYLLDCFTELFIWEGKEANKDQKLFARRLAIKLEQQDSRPLWTGTTKVIQNGETVLFKEKLSDYAGVLPIAISAAAMEENGGAGNVAQKKPQPTIDLFQFTKAHNRPKDKEPMFDYHSSDSQVSDSISGGNIRTVDVWVVDGFEKLVYPPEMFGQFFTADSFVILVTYRKLNKDKRLIYFWQGRDCSIVSYYDDKSININRTKKVLLRY
jgi:hypothetical protein